MKFNSIFWKANAIILIVYLALFLWAFSNHVCVIENRAIVKVNKVTGRVDALSFSGKGWVRMDKATESQ